MASLYTVLRYSHSQTVQKDTEDTQSPSGISNLRYLFTWFCLIAQQMFIFCEECKEDICRIPWMFSYGYSCEEKHMMCVMFYCNLLSFISPFSAYDGYCRHSHVLHLTLGLFTSGLL